MFGMELMDCHGMAVPREVMQHVVRVESSFNPYAIGVVGGRLARQPRTLPEAVATARMLERRGYNFSLGLAQVNRHNLARQGLASYEQAFQACPNLQAGSRILAECHGRSGGSWGRAFSCYYSGNFTTGYRHGYVQKVFASMRGSAPATADDGLAIQVIDRAARSPAAAGSPAAAPASDRTAAPSRIAAAARSRPVSGRSSPAARIAARVAGATATHATAGATDVAPGTAAAPPAADATVAVLDAGGGPPRLLAAAPPAAAPPPRSSTAPATPAAAPPAATPPVTSDAAFVF